MASRRTRIKGIANIPQRRKTINNALNCEENEKQIDNCGEVDNGEHNLNVTHEKSQHDNTTDELLINQSNNTKIETLVGKEANTDTTDGKPEEFVIPKETSFTSEDKCRNVSNRENSVKKTTTTGARCGDILSFFPTSINGVSKTVIKTTNNANETVDNIHNDPKQYNVVPARRKFIKPTVSSNAFNRRSRDSQDGDGVKTVEINHSNGAKNGKIVILNEIIAYPDQSQAIVIQDHPYNGHSVLTNGEIQTEEQSLKPPDTTIIRPLANSLERDIKRLIPSSPQILIPEVEYPIPPPSPSKINRARIKAVPRLGQRTHNTSFSASESEDETRRNYRHRNDSVCSSASGLQDTNSIPECPSPQKPKEFNSVIQRKCRRTEQSRKLAEARRDFYLKFGNKKPDRQKLTMIDLIFYNPVTNPMSDNKNKRKDSVTESENQDDFGEEDEAVDNSKNKTESDEENEIPAPQIKIGPTGELIVDEQSLIIENKEVKKNREQIQKSELINGNTETGYGMYKRVKRSKDWSKEETLKFYKALNTIGTDFTLMCELFPRRTRRELKMKFKKEERVNKALVDKAIMQPCGFDFDDFKHEVEMEEKELQAIEEQREREKELKKEAKKRKLTSEKKEPPEKIAKIEKPNRSKKKKPFNILSVLSDDDADESEIESIEDEENEEKFLQTLQKPTRSGRIPKVLNKYKPPEVEKDRAKPGSLIVMATTGENGQPVYKVCMVTGEYGRQQIGEDMTSLEKALECKENGITSLFTLTASSADGHITSFNEQQNFALPAVENNITIPAEENIITPLEENVTDNAEVEINSEGASFIEAEENKIP